MSIRSASFVLLGTAVPVYVAKEEVEVGRSVFQHFVHDEFQGEGLNDDILEGGDTVQANGFNIQNFTSPQSQLPQTVQISEDSMGIPYGYKSAMERKVGSTIRELANEFARSSQRQQIRKTADQVDLGSINQDVFWDLLEEVFSDGITQHALIALFYFCRDILVRCIRQKLQELGVSLFRWSMKYIAERVCAWVHNHGGWESICRKAWSPSLVLAIGVFVGALFLVWRS